MEMQPLNIAEMWERGRAASGERRKQSTLRDFLQPALSGDKDALAQVYGADPTTGMQVQKFGADQQKAQADALKDQLAQVSAVMASGGDQYASQLYPQWREMMQKATGMQLPESYDPGAMQVIKHIAGIKEPEQYTLTPGSKRFDASGRVVAEVPMEQKFEGQWDSDRGVWIPKPSLAPQQPQMMTGGGAGVLDSAFADAVQGVESADNPNAVSPAGARGLMQLMPATARELEQKLGMPLGETDRNPQANRRAGEHYLQQQMQKYGDPRLALAAYNAGPGRVDQALRASGGNVDAALARLPAETRAYVPKVLGRAQGGAQGGLAAIPVAGIGPKPKQKDAPSGYQWAPDGQSLVPIKGGPADRKANPLPADQAKDERQMRQELASQLKDQRTVVNAYQKVQAAAQNPNAMSDIALIYGYMKMLDPGSVVREGEFATAQNAAGVPDQVLNIYNRAREGLRLNPNQRQQIVAEAKKVHDVAAAQIAEKEMEYGQMAEEYGYDARRATGSALATAQGRETFQKIRGLIEEGRQAIRNGANRNAVKRRLVEMGYRNAAERL